jgi:hypothetical protein
VEGVSGNGDFQTLDEIEIRGGGGKQRQSRAQNQLEASNPIGPSRARDSTDTGLVGEMRRFTSEEWGTSGAPPFPAFRRIKAMIALSRVAWLIRFETDAYRVVSGLRHRFASRDSIQTVFRSVKGSRDIAFRLRPGIMPPLRSLASLKSLRCLVETRANREHRNEDD